MSHQFDETDRAIVRVLRTDARLAVSAVAERVRISRANAYARIKRMTDEGLIVGATLVIDPVIAGFHSSAYVALSIDQGQWQSVRDSIIAIDAVEHIALVGGEFDALVLLRAQDNRELRRIVLGQLQAMPGVRSTRTFLVYEDADAPTQRARREAGHDHPHRDAEPPA